jgi:hypothetical protein
MALDRLSRGCEGPEKGDPHWCWPSGSLVDQIFHGEHRPYRASLSKVRLIRTFMRVVVVELLCQAATGWISDLECLLLGAHGIQWLCLLLSGIKWPCWPRMSAFESVAQDWRLRVILLGVSGVCWARPKKRDEYRSRPGISPHTTHSVPQSFAVWGNYIVTGDLAVLGVQDPESNPTWCCEI